MFIARVAPREDDFEEHKHTLSIDNIWAIAIIKPSRSHGQLDMFPEAIFTEMIQLCINTLTYDAITPEKEAIGYFVRKSYSDYLLGMKGKQVRRKKAISSYFKECLENRKIWIEYQKVQ